MFSGDLPGPKITVPAGMRITCERPVRTSRMPGSSRLRPLKRSIQVPAVAVAVNSMSPACGVVCTVHVFEAAADCIPPRTLPGRALGAFASPRARKVLAGRLDKRPIPAILARGKNQDREPFHDNPLCRLRCGAAGHDCA